jgi:hypothetical protein
MFIQSRSTIPPIFICDLKALNTKNTTTYVVVNHAVPCLGQAHKCGWVKLVNEIPTLSLLIIESFELCIKPVVYNGYTIAVLLGNSTGY